MHLNSVVKCERDYSCWDIDYFIKKSIVDRIYFGMWHKNALLYSMEIIVARYQNTALGYQLEYFVKDITNRCWEIIKVRKWPHWYGIKLENKIRFEQHDLIIYVTEHLFDHIPGLLRIIESYVDDKYMSYFEINGELDCGKGNISRICCEFFEHKKSLKSCCKF